MWLAASKQQSHMKRAHQQRYGAADVRADLDPDMRSMVEGTGDGATQVSGEDMHRYDSRVVGLAQLVPSSLHISNGVMAQLSRQQRERRDFWVAGCALGDAALLQFAECLEAAELSWVPLASVLTAEG